MNKFLSLLAGGALLALVGTAHAAQPLTLSAAQMDGVTAGGVAIANGLAVAIGTVQADTVSQTLTNVSTVSPVIAEAESVSQALASGFLYQSGASAHSDTAASLP
jgi:hypothetical protein